MSSLLPFADFRFDMGLRRGSLDYFRQRGPESLLSERQSLLQSCPDNYAASLPATSALVIEAGEFALQAGCEPGAARASPSRVGPPVNPLLTDLGSRWEPDFVLLDANLRVQAGCVCFPSFWSLPEKLGQPIGQVHGPVPSLNDALGEKIRVFLDRLKPDDVWERWNWGLAATPALNCHPALLRPRLQHDATLDTTWLRVEHQALLRLPRTQSILFGIRVSVRRLREEVLAAPTFGPALRRQLQTMPTSVAHYKGLAECRNTLIEQLG